MKTVKGMIQVAGTTYRIARVAARHYSVTRILDEAYVGSFFLGPPLELTAGQIALPELHNIALSAIRDAKTSWIGNLGSM